MRTILTAFAFVYLFSSAPCQAAGTSSQTAHVLYQRGQDASAAHDLPAALTDFRRAGSLDPSNLIYLLAAAQTDVAMSRYADARRLLVSHERRFTDPFDHDQILASLADTEFAWGQVLAGRDNNEAAIPHLLSAAEYDGSHRGANGACDYEQLALADAAVGDTDDVEWDMENARRLRAIIRDFTGEASDLNALGLMRDSDGRSFEAVEAFDQAELIDPDKNTLGSVINNRGLAYQNADRYEEAIADFKRAQRIAHAAGDTHREAAAMNNIGSDMHALGQYALAIGYYRQAIVLFRADHNARGEAVALSNIGYAEFYLKNYHEAKLNLTQSIALYRSIDAPLDLEIAIGNLGCVERAAGDLGGAASLENQALTKAQSLDDSVGQGLCLLELGRIALANRHPEKAIACLDRALIILRDTDAQGPQAKVCDALMESWIAQERPGLAIFWGKQAVNTYQSIRGNIRGLDMDLQAGYARTHSDAYRELADLLITQGRLPEAQKVLNLLKLDELDEYERAGRMLIRGDRTATRGGRMLVRINRPLVRSGRILVRGNRTLVRSGRMLVRGNRTLVRGGRMLVRGNRQDVRLGRMLVRGNRNQARQGEVLAQSMAGIDVIEMSSPESKLATLVASADTVTLARDLARLPSGFATAGKPTAISAASMHGTPAPGTAFIATLVGANRLSVIVTTHTRQLSVSTPLAAGDLDREVYALRTDLEDPSSNPQTDAHRLYAHLLPPTIMAVLEQDHVTQLVWSLDGALRYIPVAALYDGRHYLVERFSNLVYLPDPALKDLAIDRKITPTGQAFAVQNVDLASTTRTVASVCTTPVAGGNGPRSGKVCLAALGLGVTQSHIVTDPITGTETEFDALPSVSAELHHVIHEPGSDGGVLTGTILLDAGFSAKTMRLALAPGRSVVHIASHFQLLPGDDAQSYLLLGDGTPMTVAQMEGQSRLFRDVDMLTLSACSTAVGGDGKEVDGLAGVARAQGALSVIATLWPVTDPSTLQLMTTFYARRATGVSKPEALRQAQLALLDGQSSNTTPTTPPPYAHPYYWAPFILMGDAN